MAYLVTTGVRGPVVTAYLVTTGVRGPVVTASLGTTGVRGPVVTAIWRQLVPRDRLSPGIGESRCKGPGGHLVPEVTTGAMAEVVARHMTNIKIRE